MGKRKTINATLCYVQDQREGRTLMLHRIKKKNDVHEGKYNGLGGKLEPGESPEECVVREVKEESGLDIFHPRLRGVMTFPEFDGVNDWYVFLYTADSFEGELTQTVEGNLEWVPTERLHELPLWEGDYMFLDWLKKEKFFSAKFIYREKQLIERQVVFY